MEALVLRSQMLLGDPELIQEERIGKTAFFLVILVSKEICAGKKLVFKKIDF